MYMSFNAQKAFLRFTTVLITTAGLSLVLGFFLFFKNINRVINVWGEVEKVTVYLDSEVNEKDISSVIQKINTVSGVEQVKHVSKEEAVEDFKSQVAGYVKDIKKDVNLMQVIPSYLEVSIKPESSFDGTINKLNAISEKIQNFDFVEEVSYGSVWMDKYSKFIDYSSRFAFFVGSILIIATFLVISNLIKTNLYQRSKEIEVLEMIGATKSYIRKPFLIEGALMSFIGGILAIIIIGAMFLFLGSKFETQVKFFKLEEMFHFLSASEVALFLMVSLFIGFCASYINLLRFRWNSLQ